MAGWNCRLVERNGDPKGLPWLSIEAASPEQAAKDYCHTSQVWDHTSWCDGDEAVVEVGEHGGESGVHRFAISAYNTIQFDAESLDETVT